LPASGGEENDYSPTDIDGVNVVMTEDPLTKNLIYRQFFAHTEENQMGLFFAPSVPGWPFCIKLYNMTSFGSTLFLFLKDKLYQRHLYTDFYFI